METIFVQALNRAKAVSPAAQQGVEAISKAAGQAAREFISDKIVALHDIITIPRMEGDEAQQWLNSPAVKNGNNILHPICKVVSVVNGVAMPAKAMPIFIGTLIKEVANKDNGTFVRSTIVDRAGQPIIFDDCADLPEQWRKLAGRTFVVESVDEVPCIKRSSKTLQSYETKTTICHFREQQSQKRISPQFVG